MTEGFWTTSRQQTVCAMWRNGQTMQEIADEVGATRSAIGGYLRRNRLTHVARRQHVEPALIPVDIISAISQGWKIGDRVLVRDVRAFTCGIRDFHDWTSEAIIDMIKGDCVRVAKDKTTAWIYGSPLYGSKNDFSRIEKIVGDRK